MFPLSTYKDTTTGIIHPITSDDVKDAMRQLAMEIHYITNSEEINLFTSLSLRVGACCILYSTGYQPSLIQKLFRWRGDSRQDYIRDLVCVTMQHNDTMHKSDEITLC